MSIRTERPNWRREGACYGMPTSEVDRIFYPTSDTDSRTAEARAICASCPVRTDCLAFALSIPKADDSYGIFGATTPRERRAIRAKGTI